jgi:hypothetical protein
MLRQRNLPARDVDRITRGAASLERGIAHEIQNPVNFINDFFEE